MGKSPEQIETEIDLLWEKHKEHSSQLSALNDNSIRMEGKVDALMANTSLLLQQSNCKVHAEKITKIEHDYVSEEKFELLMTEFRNLRSVLCKIGGWLLAPTLLLVVYQLFRTCRP
jgi:hypothetical protein